MTGKHGEKIQIATVLTLKFYNLMVGVEKISSKCKTPHCTLLIVLKGKPEHIYQSFRAI